jgi:hypothetical protein
MQTLRLEIQDNMIDKIMWLLGNFQDVKVENITNDNLNDIQLFEEAKKDTQGIKDIDEMLKEYNIEG